MNTRNIPERQCSVDGCNRRHECKGLCHMHNNRMRRNGTLQARNELHYLSFNDKKGLRDFLLKNKKETSNGCWEWTRSKPGGYGQQFVDGKKYRVHRISMVAFRDFDITSKSLIIHCCDNPPCFNPAHLYVGTPEDNAWDMMRRERDTTSRKRRTVI